MQKSNFTRMKGFTRMKEFSNVTGDYHKANFRKKKERVNIVTELDKKERARIANISFITN